MIQECLITPVQDRPVLELSYGNIRAFVISDLHIGLEHELSRAGFRIGRISRAIVKEVIDICRWGDINELYIAGDLTHRIPGRSMMEIDLIKGMLDDLSAMGIRVVVVKGNHDGGIQNILKPPAEMHERYYMLKKCSLVLFHGHTLPHFPEGAEHVVLGHIHPAVYMDGRVRRCWLKGVHKGLRVIIMPAFNPFVGSCVVNACAEWGKGLDKGKGPETSRNEQKRWAMESLKWLDSQRFRVYLLNGLDVGTVRGLNGYYTLDVQNG